MCALIQLLVVELELQHVSRLLGLQLSVFEMLGLRVVQDLPVQFDALPGPARTRKTRHGWRSAASSSQLLGIVHLFSSQSCVVVFLHFTTTLRLNLHLHLAVAVRLVYM